MELTLWAVVAVALFFDFTNGFHDTANSIATSVSTKALSPRAAVASAAVLNFAGAFVSVAVAATIATGIVDQDAITLDIVLAGLVGAITWNLITWFVGLPSSSSHALIGGMIGSAIAAEGIYVVQWQGILDKVLIPSLIAPILGIAIAFVLILGITWLIARRAPEKVNRVFRRAQLVSGGFVAFTHGTNDAQKTMGIIALALVASGHLSADFDRPPTWVIASSALAMAAGTYAGGWRIIRTLGAADREDRPAAGLRGPDRLRVDPLGDGALRLPGLDDPDDLRLGPGRRRDPRLPCRPLGGRREHPRGVDPDAAGRRPRRRRDGGRDAPPRRGLHRVRAGDPDRRHGVHGPALGGTSAHHPARARRRAGDALAVFTGSPPDGHSTATPAPG